MTADPTPVDFVKIAETYRIENQRLREEVKIAVKALETIAEMGECFCADFTANNGPCDHCLAEQALQTLNTRTEP